MSEGGEPSALWIGAPGRAEIRPAAPGDGAVTVETLYTGISRGTERLVFSGEVPESEWERMRAPFQEGRFAFPVKYGYSAVGRARGGDLDGRVVFCLHPHQTWFRAGTESLLPLPPQVPAERAILGANMETALNIVWDGGLAPADRVAVIGAGAVGALTAYLCARMPGTETTLVDIDPARKQLAEALGCRFALPGGPPADCDVSINTSASPAGLETALAAAGPEARVVEASWYGTRQVSVGLGGAFHSRRLSVVSSQVGAIAPQRRPRWTNRRRLARALDLLADPRLDILISGETAFADLPADYARILDAPGTLCHRVRYA